MKKRIAYPLPLRTEKVLFKREWILLELFEYCRDNGEVIQASVGFHFDFLSIPRILWTVVGSPTSRGAEAGCIHDFLCVTMPWPRDKTDRIFLEGLRDCGVPYLNRMVMYWAVRMQSFFIPSEKSGNVEL